ncbi:MAG: beta-ketoacyl synthase [Bacteroidetes bacterium]|nr:MAG: beta-ketoacyl synthase [Bacteroidota bacterium]
MKEVYIAGDNIISSLGFTTTANMDALRSGQIGLNLVTDPTLFPSPLPLSLVDTGVLEEQFREVLTLRGKTDSPQSFTRLEKFFIISIHSALAPLPIVPEDTGTLFVLSTTKGNIELLEVRNKNQFDSRRVFLWEMAHVVRDFFGFAHPPLIVSNACISGIVALVVAFRYLRTGMYEHAVVSGGDILSEFVISGFQSFQSLSPTPCRPYDAGRDGLSLGEGAGTMVLTTDRRLLKGAPVRITGAATSNDANHISGPSRTGEELSLAMLEAMKEAALSPADIGFINAHGTATPFNDEMESKSIALAGLLDVPVNSLKGYWGHTLGAAGVIESVVAVHALEDQLLIRSAGFETPGVPHPIRVISETVEQPMNSCLKTASGFGGCNAAILFERTIP